MTEPLPPYDEFPCSSAPLRPGEAPKDGCKCKVCEWLRDNEKRRADCE